MHRRHRRSPAARCELLVTRTKTTALNVSFVIHLSTACSARANGLVLPCDMGVSTDDELRRQSCIRYTTQEAVAAASTWRRRSKSLRMCCCTYLTSFTRCRMFWYVVTSFAWKSSWTSARSVHTGRWCCAMWRRREAQVPCRRPELEHAVQEVSPRQEQFCSSIADMVHTSDVEACWHSALQMASCRRRTQHLDFLAVLPLHKLHELGVLWVAGLGLQVGDVTCSLRFNK